MKNFIIMPSKFTDNDASEGDENEIDDQPLPICEKLNYETIDSNTILLNIQPDINFDRHLESTTYSMGCMSFRFWPRLLYLYLVSMMQCTHELSLCHEGDENDELILDQNEAEVNSNFFQRFGRVKRFIHKMQQRRKNSTKTNHRQIREGTSNNDCQDIADDDTLLLLVSSKFMGICMHV